jgi:hypothetical protein
MKKIYKERGYGRNALLRTKSSSLFSRIYRRNVEIVIPSPLALISRRGVG